MLSLLLVVLFGGFWVFFFLFFLLFFVLLKCMPDSTLSCLVAEKMEERKRKEMKNWVVFHPPGP